jgi:hypothetical protein
VVGAANTAFDVVEDCHHAGLQTTMVVRTPTWLIPVDYVGGALGLYEKVPYEVADAAFSTPPIPVSGQMSRAGTAHHASLEPYVLLHTMTEARDNVY